MPARERDEHDISSAMNRATTFLTFDWRYAGTAVFTWLTLLPYSGHIAQGFVRSVVMFGSLAGLLYLAWYYGRDPGRLPTRLLSIVRARHYSALKRRLS